MPSLRMILDVSDEVFNTLNERAEALMAAEAPPTQYEWLHGTPEGRELWIDISCRGKYNRLSNQELNSMIRQQYRAAIGDAGMGRPPIGIYRAKAAAEYIQQGLGLSVVKEVPKRPDTSSANFADAFMKSRDANLAAAATKGSAQ